MFHPSKMTLTVGLFALFILGAAAPAQADPLVLNGTTQGRFNAGAFGSSVNLGDNSLTPIVTGLTFTGASFNATANPSAFVALGAFDLAPLTSFNFNGDSFTLRVTFTAPAGITGGNAAQFTADLDGNIRIIDPFDNVDIVFNNPTRLFTFSNAAGTGSFRFTVEDITNLNEGQTRTLFGVIRDAQYVPVPEPATMLLLGTGLAGVGAAARKRRRAAKAEAA